MARLVLIIALLFPAATPAWAVEKEPVGTGKPQTVPFELLPTKHMAVKIKINGKGPYRVIFDTGAPITVLNNKIAKEAELLKDAPKSAFNLFGAGGPVSIKTLELGDVKAEKVPVIIMDHPTVALLAKAVGPIDGIIGFPFFARYRLTLDYQTQNMTLVPNGYDPPDVLAAMMTAVLALTRQKQAAPQILAPAALWGFTVAKKAKEDDEAGVMIQQVLPASPAAVAGLQVGDRMLTLDGRWTDSVTDLYTAAGYVKPGSTVQVSVKRGKKELSLTVKPAAGS